MSLKKSTDTTKKIASTNNKAIVYFGGFEMPNLNAAANRVKNIGNIYEELGYNIYYVGTTKKDADESQFISLSSKQFYKSLPYPKTLKEWIKYETSIKNQLQILNSIEDRIVAIFCYDYPSIQLKKLIKYCKNKNIKVISDITEWTNSEGSVFKKIAKGLDTFYRMRFINKEADGIIAISDYLYNYYSGKCRNLIRVPVLVDSREIFENKYLASFNPQEKIVFSYIGFSTKRKDRLDWIVECLRKISLESKNVLLNLAGCSENDFLKNFGIDIFHNKEYSFINFLGKINHFEALKIIGSSHYTIFLRRPTRKNKAGFPTKFAESMQAGTPVITSNTHNLDSYLVDGVNGYFVSNNKHELDKKIKLIVKNHPLVYKTLLLNCQDYKSFSFDEYIDEFLLFNKKMGL